MKTGGAAVGVKEGEQRGKRTQTCGGGVDCPGVRDMFPQFHTMPPVTQEVSDPPAGVESGTLSWESL